MCVIILYFLRWLAANGRVDEARLVLTKIRRRSDDDVNEELGAILAAIEAERAARVLAAPPPASELATTSRTPERATWTAQLHGVRRQLRLGVGLMLLQQLVGINTLMYYSATILKQAAVIRCT